MPVSGKRVLVTGGASGIGAGVVELLAASGATVVIADVAETAGRALADRLGNPHGFIKLDVSDQESWRAAMPVIAPEGMIDIIILNAGVMLRPAGESGLNDPLPWMTRPRLDRLLGVNLYGVIWGMLECLPAVEKAGGTMMVVSSAGGLYPVTFDPAYAMTKHGLIGLTTSLAPTMADHGVSLVTVCPHSVDTAMQPPDLVKENRAAGYSSPPSHMAESMLHIYEHAANGEVWQSVAEGMPFKVEMRPSIRARHLTAALEGSPAAQQEKA